MKRFEGFSQLDSEEVARRSYRIEDLSDEAESWQEGMIGAAKASVAQHQINAVRHFILPLLAVIFFVLFVFQLVNLQIIQGAKNLEMAEGNRIRSRVIRADRGAIFDRNGNILAGNKPSYDVVAIPFDLNRDVKKRAKTLSEIAEILGVSTQKLEEKIKQKKDASNLDPVILAENITREKAFEIESKKDRYPGISVEKNSIRDYPQGSILAHLLGYTGRISQEEYQSKDGYYPNDLLGKNGIEKEYEDLLRGKFGKEQIEVDSTGKLERVLASIDSEPGQNLKLNIDLGLQKVLYQALADNITRVSGKGGAAVALDPKTGAVLALVSYPSFDNNLFAKGISQKEYQDLVGNELKPLFNRATTGEYPPGSTVKIITATAGLQEGVISADTILFCPGVLKIVNPYNPDIVYTFPDWKLSGFGNLSVREAIAFSSDVFFYQVGGGFEDFLGLGLSRLKKWQQKFGLGVLTGIDFPEEASGLVPDENWKKNTIGEDWYVGDTYHMAIGQGYLLLTPLQLANATAIIANGGILYVPRILSEVQDANGKTIKKSQIKIAKKNIADPGVLAVVREGMRGAVQYGTARQLNDLPVAVAGKTGTAEFAGGTKGHEHAWFTSFAPYEDPEIVITVLVEAGGEGTDAAVPVAKEGYKYWFSR